MSLRINYKSLLLTLFIFGTFCFAKAQSDEEQLKQIEKYIENTEQSGDYNDLADQLNYSIFKKLNLNKASPFDMLSLGILTPEQVRSIFRHKLEFGDFLSPLELQTIDEITPETIKLLIPLITVEINEFELRFLGHYLKNADKNLTTLISASSPLSKGYKTYTTDSLPFFPGPPFQLRLRYKANYKNNVLFGLNAENDAGEDFFMRSNKNGFDYYSVHFFIHKKGLVRKLALGDFQAAFGQGLTLSSGSGYGKSAMVLSVKRLNTGLRPYRSFNENEFLRGGGVTLGFKNFESTSFISKSKIDATIENSGSEVFLKSFVTDGYHRSQLEIDKEKTATKTLFGQNLNCKLKNLMLGLTGVYAGFDKPLESDDKIYNRYYFQGKNFIKTGFNFDYFFKNINVFGEAVTGSEKANGYMAGAFISLASALDLVIVNRYYSRKFIWYNTGGFSENSNLNNEFGTYVGFNIKLSKKLAFSGYADSYKTPWYSYYTDGWGRGLDYLAELSFKPGKSSVIYVRLRTKDELKNTPGEKYNELGWFQKSNLRFHCELKVLPSVIIKARAEFSKPSFEGYKTRAGNLIYLDFIYRKINSPVSISSRIAFFNISDFNARIYAVENDVIYSFSVHGFYGSGTKCNLLVKYKFRDVRVQCRYSLTKYYDRTSVGSGYSTVNSANINEINLLISYGFL